jgi:hypothetical protein
MRIWEIFDSVLKYNLMHARKYICAWSNACVTATAQVSFPSSNSSYSNGNICKYKSIWLDLDIPLAWEDKPVPGLAMAWFVFTFQRWNEDATEDGMASAPFNYACLRSRIYIRLTNSELISKTVLLQRSWKKNSKSRLQKKVNKTRESRGLTFKTNAIRIFHSSLDAQF